MHQAFMLAALDQARLGRGYCAPNPSVGAVIVHEGKIIASGYHRQAGGAHAEREALEAMPAGLKHASLYVTLEPCNHLGKTPPCVDAIIKAGISSVVYGYTDPNPLVMANNTPAILRENGIEVIYYPLAEVDAYYSSYAFWLRHKRPWVKAKIAQSLDGKIAEFGGKPKRLSNQYCQQFTHLRRDEADLILTTAKTIEKDDPQLNVRLGKQVKGKPIAIIDRHLSLSPKARVLKTATHCHIFYDNKLRPVNPLGSCTYHPLPATDKGMDLKAVLNSLGSLGFHEIWVEAGGKLFSALHHLSLVENTYIYIVPTLVGKDGVNAYHGDDFFQRPHQLTWQSFGDNMLASIEWGKNCKS